MERLHLIIRGRVQGVSYRYSTVRQAESLGVVGWVRNLPGGEVEVVAEGARDPLEALLAWCWDGPRHASVTDIEVEWAHATGDFIQFAVAR